MGSKLNYVSTGWEKNTDDRPQHNGIAAHHGFYFDHHLGPLVCMARRLPCFCEACEKKINQDWDVPDEYSRSKRPIPPMKQSKFKLSLDCKYHNELNADDLNNWKLITMEKKKSGEKEDQQEKDLYDLIHEYRTEHQGQSIQIGDFAAVNTSDDGKKKGGPADGYYLVQWVGEPFELEEDMHDYADEKFLPKGELMCEAIYWSAIGTRAPRWYTPPDDPNTSYPIRVQYVLATNLQMHDISNNNKLPPGYSKDDSISSKQPMKVPWNEHQNILLEQFNRTLLDYEEQQKVKKSFSKLAPVKEYSDDESDEEDD